MPSDPISPRHEWLRINPETGRRLFTAAAAISILLFFFTGAGSGLSAYFTSDDLINMNHYQDQSLTSLLKANIAYFSPSYRPLGGLFYRPLFAAFGLNPLPFRIVCFVLLILNIGIAWWLACLLTQSTEIAALSTLLGAFHPRLVDLYWSTGTIYDILCFTFFFATLGSYISLRTRGRTPSAAQIAGIIVLYICALNAKEMAVAIPVLLIAWELIYPDRPTAARLIVPAMLGALTIPYLIGKLQPSSPLAQLDRYHPVITLQQFLETCSAYLGQLTYSTPSTVTTGALFCTTLTIAAALRSRTLLFAWIFAMVSALPVAFIPARNAFAFYIPLAGWSLYLAALIVEFRDRLLRRPGTTITATATFLIALLLLLRAHRIQRHRMGGRDLLGQPLIRRVATNLSARHAVFPKGARVLAVNDPFTGDRYELVLLLRLYAKDPTITVDHASQPDATHDLTLIWNGQDLY